MTVADALATLGAPIGTVTTEARKQAAKRVEAELVRLERENKRLRGATTIRGNFRDEWRERAEALEAERDEAREKCEIARESAAINAEQARVAEAENTRLRDGLRLLWDHYLLPITDEQKSEIRALLAEDGAA